MRTLTRADDHRWEALLAFAVTNTPFQTVWYQRAWQSHLLPASVTCEYLGLERGHELVAVLPVMTAGGGVSMHGGTAETDYLDLIVESSLAPAAWEELASHVLWSAPSLEVQAIPESSPTRAILGELAETHGWTYSETIVDQCPQIALPSDFDTYLAGLGKHQRHEIRRKLRRAAEVNVEVEVLSSDEDIDQAARDFTDLFRHQRDEEKVNWMTRERRDFIADVIRSASEARALCLSFALVDGARCAALLCFEYASTVWVYNTAVSASVPGNLSIGTVLMVEQIRRAIERGAVRVDFMRGTEGYKSRLGGVPVPLYSARLARTAA